jgi:hypothetical protein
MQKNLAVVYQHISVTETLYRHITRFGYLRSDMEEYL